MVWIIVATLLNTIWTLWCVQQLPPRVATHFGLGGQANGWMSRKGFGWFSILFPLALSAFILFTTSKGQSPGAMPTQMEHLAAGLILFFSFMSWSIVRSNRKNPPRVDWPSLLVSIAALLIFISVSVGPISKAADQPGHSVSTTGGAQ